jgi:hypothetical protein
VSQVEVLALLAEQEVACQAEVDRLRAEGERITVLLGERESELAEIATACRVVGRLSPSSAAASEVRPVTSASSAVPAPRDALELSWQEIAERIPGVLANYPGGVRAGQVAADLGLEPAARQVERVRHALRRSVAHGAAVAVPGGAFALKR